MRLPVNRNLPLAALILLSACGGGASVKDVPPLAANGPAADYPMVIGAPFTVDGVTYSPADTMNYDAVGQAVVGTAGGGAISGAHRTLPLPSYVEVTSLETGKTILVRIERRGPVAGAGLIELSPGAAAQIGLVGSAKPGVRVRRVNPPEVERATLRQGQVAPARMDTPKSLLAVLQRKLDQQMGIAPPPPAPETAVVPSPPVEAAAAPTQKPPVKPSGKASAKLAPKAVATPMAKANPAPVATPEAAKQPLKPMEKPTAKAANKSATPAHSASDTKREASGTYFIQVGAFANKANAEAAARKTGGSAGETGKFWRVRVGPFADADKAKPALAKAKDAGYSDARIQRAN
ncbi:MAG: SPOR domain-containing protein [Sphingomonadales bacterium]|nr:SPOR domain-containing protein [Sphingomonadales bacterium]